MLRLHVVIPLLFAASFAGSPQEVRGQNANDNDGIESCRPADLDTDLQFAREASSYLALALNFRNDSDHDCRLNDPAQPSIVPSPPTSNQRFEMCWDCDYRRTHSEGGMIPSTILKRADTVHLLYRWKTESDDPKNCAPVGWITTFTYLVVAPAIVKNICSPVEIGRYVPGVFAGVPLENLRGDQTPVLKLLADSTPYYDRQPIQLRATAEEPRALLPDDANACPLFLQRSRSFDGTTRWDQIGEVNDWSCRATIASDSPARPTISMTMPSGHLNRWGGIGDHTSTLFQIVPSDNEGAFFLVPSNSIVLPIRDPKTLARHWGPQSKGVAVDVTLDRDTFEAGEDVPLHIAMENFSAEVPILSNSVIWHPCEVVAIEVRDTFGHPVHSPTQSLCMGSGPMGLWRYPKGNIVTLEKSLSGEGMLPDTPGIYTISVSWPVEAGEDDSCDLCQIPAGLEPGAHYAVAQTTKVFRVVKP